MTETSCHADHTNEQVAMLYIIKQATVIDQHPAHNQTLASSQVKVAPGNPQRKDKTSQEQVVDFTEYESTAVVKGSSRSRSDVPL